MSKHVTSAVVNKMIRSLEDEKDSLLRMEIKSCKYYEVNGVTPVVPEYDYRATQKRLTEIDSKVVELKHELNLFNMRTVIDGTDITLDTALVKMAQLSKRKDKLKTMKDRLAKEPLVGYDSRNTNDIKYECINYKIEDVELDYQRTSKELEQLQIGIDLANQTKLFEIAE